jgi:FtsZ-binding cell division protein ZapB
MSTNEIELEPYREVIDMLAARIKRAEQRNTYLSEAAAECQKRVERLERENERLNAELENVAWKSSPALAQAQIDQLAKDKARLDWLLTHPLEFAPVQIPCPDGRPGCLVYHCRPQTPAECRAAIDAAMEAMTPAPSDDLQDDN